MPELWEVEYFELSNGKFPARAWLLGLKDELSRAKVDARIRRASVGNFGDHKNLGAGLIELRIHWGPGLRVYFYRCEASRRLIIFQGGTKASQKRDLYRAKIHLKQWRSRN